MASAAVTDSFKHEPLDATRQQIRLISITPESSSDIKCQLRNAFLEDATTPDYRAVSYEWGPPLPLRRISVNGQLLQVRQNLYAFLEVFRARLFRFQSNSYYEAETQWLWIDQICINQTVISERNHQVKMMSEIYSRATYVYVWLGPSQANVEKAMTILKSSLRSYYESRTARSPTTQDKSHQSLQVKEGCNAETKTYDRSTALLISALNPFFENMYWQRLWIVQEIMLARYIRIMCGETLLSWEELRRFCLTSVPRLPAQVQDAVPQQLIWLAEHALSAKTYTYSNLLTTFSKSQCLDPKDKVYGLQGLVAPDRRVCIDYASSTYDVFKASICLMMQDQGYGTKNGLRNGLDQLNYDDATDTILQASLLVNAEIESIIRLPLFAAIKELGDQMGVPMRLTPQPSQESSLRMRINSVWSEIVAYYNQERLPALFSQGAIGYHRGEAFEGTYDLTMLLKDLWRAYEELKTSCDGFVSRIASVIHSKQRVTEKPLTRSINYQTSDEGRDRSRYILENLGKYHREFVDRSEEYQAQIEVALEDVAYNIVAHRYGMPFMPTRCR